MRAIRGDGPDVRTVIAAQGGDREALDALLSEYLPLLYNIVGRALNGHADVDDVVQETMLRAVRGLGDLRDPAAFRSWLVAVAVRQVRDHFSARQLRLVRGPVPEVADPDGDFVDLTIARLGLSGQRRETAEATRWLDEEDRELLALWWQEAAGALDRSAVAAGLGMTPAHTAVRIGRMKERLTTARLVVRALRARPSCDALAAVTVDWDLAPSPLWRKRLARHVRGCARCGAQRSDMVPAEGLLNGLPLLPAPLLALPAAAASQAAAQHAAASQTAGQHAAASQGAAQHGAGAARWGLRRPAARNHVAHQHAASLHHLRLLPKTAAYLQPKVVVAAIAATSCVGAGVVAAVRIHAGSPPAVTAVHRVLPPPVTETMRPPSPSAAATTGHPRHRPHKPAPAPSPAVVTSRAKGVSAWAFPGATQALAESGASWYYNWAATPAGIATPPRVDFVPMIWGSANATTATLDQVKAEGHVLLGFNEPDLPAQANMTVARALSLWPKLMATGMELGSPGVAANAATPGGWLDQFMRGATARGYRVDFITVHWYGADFDTSAAVGQLKSYLRAIYDRYHRPIWLTELGLADYGGGTPAFPAPSQQAAFVMAAASMLAGLSYVQRYAWFALPVSSGDGSMGLFTSGPVATAVGRAFERAGR